MGTSTHEPSEVVCIHCGKLSWQELINLFLVQSIIDIVVSNQMLQMCILLVPRIFLWIIFVLLLLALLLVINIFLFGFNLEDCNSFIAASLADLSIYYKVVAFTQVFNKTGELFVCTNISLRFFLLVNIQERAVGCLNCNQEALIILNLGLSVGLMES